MYNVGFGKQKLIVFNCMNIGARLFLIGEIQKKGVTQLVCKYLYIFTKIWSPHEDLYKISRFVPTNSVLPNGFKSV